MESDVNRNMDRCVCCGAVIPEGAMVCRRCQLAEWSGPKKQQSVFSRLRKRRKKKSAQNIKISKKAP